MWRCYWFNIWWSFYASFLYESCPLFYSFPSVSLIPFFFSFCILVAVECYRIFVLQSIIRKWNPDLNSDTVLSSLCWIWFVCFKAAGVTRADKDMKSQMNKRGKPLITQIMSKEDAVIWGMNMHQDCTAGRLFKFSSCPLLWLCQIFSIEVCSFVTQLLSNYLVVQIRSQAQREP